MNRTLLFLLTSIILLLLGVVACQSEPGTQSASFPTPIVLNDVLESQEISATSNALCPDEETYRSRPQDFYEKIWEQGGAHSPTSGGLWWLMTNISEGTKIGFSTYEIPAQKTITLTYSYDYIGNEPIDSAPQTTRFLLLIDEQLTATSFNGTFLPYYDLILQSGEEGAILVDVPPLQSGIHDVLLVQVDNVNQEPKGTEITQQDAHRITLAAGGENSILTRPYDRFKPTERFWFRNPGESGFPVCLSLAQDGCMDWGAPDTLLRLPLDTSVDFYAYVGYHVTENADHLGEPLARHQPLALVMLVDYQQVPISSDNPIIYGIVTPSTKYVRLPIHLLPPQTPGLHQVNMLQIVYPGFPMCLLNGTERIYPIWLLMSRVGIEIEP